MGAASGGSIWGDVGLFMDCVGVGEAGRGVVSGWAYGSGLEVGTGIAADVEASHGKR